MKYKSFALPIVGVLFLFVNTALSEPMRIDFNQAWDIAKEKNLTISIANLEVKKANHQVSEAYSHAMPTASLDGTFQHYFKVPQTIFSLPNFDDANEPPIRIKTQFGSENNVNLGLNITQPLWLAGKVGMALEIAKDYRELALQGMDANLEDLHQQLVQLFYGAILADRFLEISNEALLQANRHLETTERLYAQGMISEYDVIRAKVAVANLRPQVISAKGQKDLTYLALKNLLGLERDNELQIIGDLESNGVVVQDTQHAFDKAEQNRSEFRQLELQASLYDGQYKIEKRNAYWPNFLLNVGWQTAAQANDWNVGKYEFLGGWGATLVLQVPLFDGFASHYRAEQALVNKKIAQRNKEMLSQGVALQINSAISDFQRAQSELSVAEETVAQAERGLSIAELRYKEGMGTQLEVLDAQLQLNTSKVNLQKAKFDLLTANAAYERALGIALKSK